MVTNTGFSQQGWRNYPAAVALGKRQMSSPSKFLSSYSKQGLNCGKSAFAFGGETGYRGLLLKGISCGGPD
ncbi:hypothetical protein RHEC894_CH02291 [Rhizobium sp. CIAT894]|nr:hypothetical protein RHEC894_CH02291 [Rhizobium sp. CIAT894]